MTIIEFAAAAFGVTGTLLLALRGKHAGWGFVAFLASNIGWILFALQQGLEGLLAQHAVFTASSLVGIYTWLWRPRVRAAQDAGETIVDAGDIYVESVAKDARIAELERHVELLVKSATTQ